jgi:hypothetical protein
MGLPGFQVAFHVNGFAVRPGLFRQICNLLSGRGLNQPAVVAVNNTSQVTQIAQAKTGQVRY